MVSEFDGLNISRGRGIYAPVKYAPPQLNSFTIKVSRSITAEMESNSCKINR